MLFRSRQSGLRLRLGDQVRLDIALAIGGADTIDVAAQAPLLQMANGSVSYSVDQTKLAALPLDGRNFIPLIALSPGVALPSGSLLPRINGSRPRTNEYLYDGISVPQPEPGQVVFYPILDGIEEFRLNINAYSPEYGRSNGGTVLVASKAGGNQFHGSLFEYLRHEKLNARNFFAQPGPNPVFRRNQYGFVLGGPIQKNKTFFFYSMEKFKQTNVVVSNSTVPTSAYRTGDFSRLISAENRLLSTAAGAATDALGRTIPSGTIFDPNTTAVAAANGRSYRDPFPGNAIPVSRFDPIAVKVLALVPLPQGPNFQRGLATNNYTGTFDSSRSTRIPSVKVDQNVGSKGRLSFQIGRAHV